MTTSTITRGTGVSTSGNSTRSSLYAPSLDGITRRHRVEQPSKADRNASTIDAVPAEAESNDADYIVPGSTLTNAEFTEVVGRPKDRNDSAAEREQQCDSPVVADLPQLEKPARQSRNKSPEEMFNDNRSLVAFFMWKVGYHYCDSIRDDLRQVGDLALWDVCGEYKLDWQYKFSTYAGNRIRWAMIGELRNQKKWKPRQFHARDDGETAESDIPSRERCPVDIAMEIERKDVVRNVLQTLPNRTREALTAWNEEIPVADQMQGLGFSHQHLSNIRKAGIESLKFKVLPMFSGVPVQANLPEPEKPVPVRVVDVEKLKADQIQELYNRFYEVEEIADELRISVEEVEKVLGLATV